MLKGIAKAISVSRAWILAFAFLAAIGVVVESSNPFQACVKEIYYNPATENFEKSVSSFSAAFSIYRDCLGDFTHDNAEAIIAAFTIILALSTIFLWVATRDLVSGAAKTARQQLRAYIAVEAGLRDGPHTMTPRFKLSFKNCGQTPAYNGEGWAEVQVHESPLVSDLIPPENKTINRFEMPPTNRFFAEHINANNVASIANRSGEFDAGKIAFYIFGRLEFVDAFDKPHWLEYRFRYGIECVVRGNLIIEEINSN